MTKPFAVILPSDSPLARAEGRLQRSRGAARVTFKTGRGRTQLDRLYQSGAAKIRLPNVADDAPPQAVLINTAGGLTGGDCLAWEAAVAGGGRAVVTTQACEKIYRAASGVAEVSTTLRLGENGRLDWLPQETILFDGACLKRRLDADLAPGAILLAVEAAIFGRTARGEIVRTGSFADRWRIRRAGRLIFADDLRFNWADAALLHRPAVLAGGAAAATILLVCDEPQRHLVPLREIIGDAGGASAWDGKLLARIVAEGGAALRRVLIPALERLTGGAVLPKVWQT
jgi:urease accessory protein